MAADIYHSISRELPQEDPFDVTKTEAFKELRATQTKSDENVAILAKNRELQAVAQSILSKLDSRAPIPVEGESFHHYGARVGDALAKVGPEERRGINRQSLPPEALAEIVKVDAEYAKAEIEHPKHSLRDGEVREVVRVDRAGHEITEFYTKNNSPSFWMDQFKGDVISFVSGGSAGIGRHVNDGCYSFDKTNLPEIAALRQQAEYEQSTEYQIRKVYAKAGLPEPHAIEIAKMLGKRA
jgi:hypothetical protein